MNFEFLIVYNHAQDTDIEKVLVDTLAEVLEENLNEFETEMVRGMIQLRHERVGAESSNENGEEFRRMLLGFVVDLPEETEQMQAVVSKFSAALHETPPIFHVVKFEDPILQIELARWSEEIFSIEMKLRRVLTIIY